MKAQVVSFPALSEDRAAAVDQGHLALVGPTASGKSAVAMEVARRLGNVELVSIDSMQVYRGMDIGTAKPTAAEQAEVPHHLLDVADPSEDFSVARFQAEAAAALADIEGRQRRALLVGGTGLYLQAVVDGLNLPGQWPDVRADLEAEASSAGGVGLLYRRLQMVDPVAASRIEPANRRRIVRALEVFGGSGRPFSSYGPGLSTYPPTSFRMVGLAVDGATLGERIDARIDAQFEAGFLDEVRQLAVRQPPLSRTARQALGYRELIEHLQGHITLNDAVGRIRTRTRQFARRQRAWFRRDPRIRWIDASDNPGQIADGLLRDWA